MCFKKRVDKHEIGYILNNEHKIFIVEGANR